MRPYAGLIGIILAILALAQRLAGYENKPLAAVLVVLAAVLFSYVVLSWTRDKWNRPLSPRQQFPHIEEYPVMDALNFKITNETVKAGLGGVEFRLNRLQQWDGHRTEFMTVSGYRPLVLIADQVDLPHQVTRIFQLLDITDRQNPKINGMDSGTERSWNLGGYGVWRVDLDLLYSGGHHAFTSYIQWTEQSGPEFIEKWPS